MRERTLDKTGDWKDGGSSVRLIAGVVAVGLMIGVMGAALATSTVGQLAPAFSLILLDGKAISLSDFKGKPVVVNFWH